MRVLGAAHNIGAVVEVTKGLVAKSFTAADMVGKPFNKTAHILWTENCVSTTDICDLPSRHTEQYVKAVLMDSIDDTDVYFEQAFAAETAIYQYLLGDNVDPCFHHAIYRHHIEKSTNELPLELSATEIEGLQMSIKEISYKLGVNVYMATETVAKCTRTLTMKCHHGDIRPTVSASVATADTIDDCDGNDDDIADDCLASLIKVINEALCLPITTSSAAPPPIHVRLSKTFTFKNMMEYIMSPTTATTLPPTHFPDRKLWKCIPFALLNDSAMDTCGFMTYIIATRDQIMTMHPDAFSEVFLANQAFSVLNFDIDMKLMDPTTSTSHVEYFVSGKMAEDFIACAAAAGCKYLQAEALCDIKFQDTSLQLWGEVSMYIREQALAQHKLSCRLLWSPPLEMCFPNMDRLKKFLTHLNSVMADHHRNIRDYFDLAPFCTHKACRLPNAQKIVKGAFMGNFKYIGTVNCVISPCNDKLKTRETMAIGLSRQTVGFDRPTISRSCTTKVLKNIWHKTSMAHPTFTTREGSSQVLSNAALSIAIVSFKNIWGPEITVVSLSDSAVRVSPDNCKIVTCPVHARMHTNATFSVLITTTGCYPHCFSDKGTPPIDRDRECFCVSFDDTGALVLDKRVKKTQ